ncbi:LysR family transcriptional regulator [Shinella sp. SUS2]|jgi:DNA-binding transcriptional LysR family regulator|uniref:LysR substrate-binding domain-containing protein n=2 Tax=Shinella TaxID=323620 RepID=UPI0006807B2E|nr:MULTISPECIES: LysR substrate-binding domain-containing protein [unclassified Shinella]KNY12910.1 LysR family transcriptional regulator [Shinella sp. SUS2]KOC71631.1 LysR family transcriptional regulator [Shinella sp. GWS1]TAA50228.1 LysR family transcriptional regulator [Shinella sp. JR1-6]
MDLRQLRHFVAVAEELHFGKAAERLHMTQPPLSQSIQALEADLGVQLFFRTKRTVRLTPIGKHWLPHARRVVDEAATLPELARRLSRGEVGTLRIAFVSFVGYSFLPRLVSRFKQSFPEVEILLSEATSNVQIDSLLAGDIDIGLMIPPSNRAMPAPLSYMPITSEELVVAMPSRWIKSRNAEHQSGTISFEDFKEKPLVLFPRAGAPVLHDLVTRFYANYGAHPVISQHAMQMQTMINLVAEGMGLAFVPSCMRSLSPAGVSYLRLQEAAPTIEVGLSWQPDEASQVVKKFVALVKDEIASRSAASSL